MGPTVTGALKYRKTRGGRVVSAADFFRSHDLDEKLSSRHRARRDTPAAALLVARMFRN